MTTALPAMISYSNKCSECVKLLRLPLILGVLYIHANMSGLLANEPITLHLRNPVNYYILKKIFADGIASASVPTLFLISGYLFSFRYDNTLSSYFRKMRSRVATLLVPLVLWNLVVLMIIYFCQENEVTSRFMSSSSDKLKNYNLLDYFKAVVGYGRYPIAYQFWFVRDLLLLCLLSPIIYICLSISSTVVMIILVMIWIKVGPDKFLISIEGLMFYSFGMLLSITHKSLLLFEKYKTYILFLYLTSLILYVVSGGVYEFIAHKVAIVAGVINILALSSSIYKVGWLKCFLLKYSNSAFFVYAAHEPLMTAMRKVLLLYNPTLSDTGRSVFFMLMPLVLCLSLVLISVFLRRRIPMVYSVFTGSR